MRRSCPGFLHFTSLTCLTRLPVRFRSFASIADSDLQDILPDSEGNFQYNFQVDLRDTPYLVKPSTRAFFCHHIILSLEAFKVDTSPFCVGEYDEVVKGIRKRGTPKPIKVLL